jgi:hypothetical protein
MGEGGRMHVSSGCPPCATLQLALIDAPVAHVSLYVGAPLGCGDTHPQADCSIGACRSSRTFDHAYHGQKNTKEQAQLESICPWMWSRT